jgi:2-keto-4-pentenoate hydratase/2-oxohepta-3-ene-1,7-dioic acid hydratase in catechol pathway
MKVSTVVHNGRASPVCEIVPGSVVEIPPLVPGIDTMMDLIEGGAPAMQRLRAAVDAERSAKAHRWFNADALEWRAPVERPSTIYHIALNNTAADPTLLYRPAFPAYFTKPAAALTGHGQPIEILPHYGLTHNEPELAVVVGRGGRNIALDQAMDHVFGYTVINDVTCVGMRKEDRFYGGYPTAQPDGSVKYVEETLTYPARYKGADTFLPAGPWIVSADQVPDPANLKVNCWLDDELIFKDTTANLHFTVAQAIFWISAHTTLFSGDMICMGTAGHPEAASKPLSYGDISKRGQTVTIEIEGVGRLVNPILRKSAPDPRQAFAPVEGLGASIRKHGLARKDTV